MKLNLPDLPAFVLNDALHLAHMLWTDCLGGAFVDQQVPAKLQWRYSRRCSHSFLHSNDLLVRETFGITHTMTVLSCSLKCNEIGRRHQSHSHFAFASMKQGTLEILGFDTIPVDMNLCGLPHCNLAFNFFVIGELHLPGFVHHLSSSQLDLMLDINGIIFGSCAINPCLDSLVHKEFTMPLLRLITSFPITVNYITFLWLMLNRIFGFRLLTTSPAIERQSRPSCCFGLRRTLSESLIWTTRHYQK